MGNLCTKNTTIITEKFPTTDKNTTLQLFSESDNANLLLFCFKRINLKVKSQFLKEKLDNLVKDKLRISTYTTKEEKELIKKKIENYRKKLDEKLNEYFYLFDYFEAKPKPEFKYSSKEKKLCDLNEKISTFFSNKKDISDFVLSINRLSKSEEDSKLHNYDSSTDFIKVDVDIFKEEFKNLLTPNKSKKSLFSDMYFSFSEKIPPEMKNIISFYVFLYILTKSNYLLKDSNYYKVNRKEIQKILQNQNIYFLERDDIIDEDYNKFFELLKNSEELNFDKAILETKQSNISKKSQVKFKTISSSNDDELKGSLTDEKNAAEGSKKNTFGFSGGFTFHENTDDEQINLNIAKKKSILKNSNSPYLYSFLFDEQYELYKGEIDSRNYLYCGIGELCTFQENEINSHYNGFFKYGLKTGLGYYYLTRKQGDKEIYEYYEGEWWKNLYHGYGNLIRNDFSTNTLSFYEGKFKNNFYFEGSLLSIQKLEKGEIIHQNYIGEFTDNMFSGSYGTLKRTKANINSTSENKVKQIYTYEYCGEFLKNCENGKGTLNFKTDSYSYKYVGDFQNGKKHGMGKIDYHGNSDIQSYEGIFQNDQSLCVFGKVLFNSGNVYEGFFDENHKKTKVGISLFNDSSNEKVNYFGGFLEDYKNGIGRQSQPNGNGKMSDNTNCVVLVGNYLQGEKDGNFYLTANQYEETDTDFRRLSNMSKKRLPTQNTLSRKSIFNIQLKIPSSELCKLSTEHIKQKKMYMKYENGEFVESSDKPIRKDGKILSKK